MLLTEHYQPLKMMKLRTNAVPEEIENIEFYNDMDELVKFQDLVSDATKDGKAYMKLCSTMVHLEECANSKPQREFSEESVVLEVHPWKKIRLKCKSM